MVGEVVGTHGDALKICLAALLIDGRANAARLKFLAKRLGVGGHTVGMVSGETSRRKRVAVTGVTVGELIRKLAAAG